MTWQIIQLDRDAATAQVQATFQKYSTELGSITPQQDPNWYLDEAKVNPSLYFCHYQDDRNNIGACLLRRHYRPVKVMFGEFTVYRYPVHRFELYGSPLIRAESRESREQIAAALLEALIMRLDRSEVLSVEALPTNTALHDCVASSRNSLSLQLGRSFMHQTINFPPSLDEYLGQMSKSSRKSVQYSQRRLAREFDVELFVCHSPEQIERFLSDAIAVSRKTYQWNLLGLGIRDKADYVATLNHWSRHADLRCYLLYCNGEPTAFMLGYIHRSCYYYIDVGYDPDWAKYSVGSVLQLMVIENLYQSPEMPTVFDFSTGYGEHKGRFGNCEQEEINVLAMPVTFVNRLFVLFYKAVDTTSNVLTGALDKLGMKKRLKKLIRRSSAASA